MPSCVSGASHPAALQSVAPMIDSPRDNAFEMAVSNIRFGPGVTREVGQDLAELGARRVLVVTDPRLAELAPVQVVRESLTRERIPFVLFDRVRVEPSDRSFREAIETASDGAFDAFVAVGGGSCIDTAKAANLYSTYPADFYAYVNAPLGGAQPVPGPLKPLIAIPTTAGTGSETTGVAIFDDSPTHSKTGIAHRRLKPALGLVDPENTRTLPASVAAASGLDVLCHALESYTAIPYTSRPRPERPILRPAYQGSNPISDVWAERSLQMCAAFLVRACRDADDDEARGAMLLAAAYAGIGFGNAGVHLCHGMSYPVSSMVRQYVAPGYPDDRPLVPHGVSVALNAPAVFRFTAPACPERHLRAARLLGADVAEAPPEAGGALLAEWLVRLLRQLELPNGLAAVGFSPADVPALVRGTLPQHRVTRLSPRPANEADLTAMFLDSLQLWPA